MWDDLCACIFTKAVNVRVWTSSLALAGYAIFFFPPENSCQKESSYYSSEVYMLLPNTLNWAGIGRNWAVKPQVPKCRKWSTFHQSNLRAVEGGKILPSIKMLSFRSNWRRTFFKKPIYINYLFAFINPMTIWVKPQILVWDLKTWGGKVVVVNKVAPDELAFTAGCAEAWVGGDETDTKARAVTFH